VTGLDPAALPPALMAGGEALGVAAALGALAFPRLEGRIAMGRKALAAGGLIVHIAAGLGRLWLTLAAAEAEPAPLSAWLADLGFLLLHTRFGGWLGADLGASLAALAALRLARPGAGLVFALAATLALSFTGHAAALPGGASLAGALAAFAHITAAGLWLGELPLLVLLLREEGVAGAPVIRSFSRRALLMVGVIALSGAGLGARLAGLGPALWLTPYGRLILAKSAIFATLLGLAAQNRLVLLPRLAAGEGEAAARLARNVRLAVTLGILLLLLAGWLATTGPAAAAGAAS
jgi:putative copper resistance protein D